MRRQRGVTLIEMMITVAIAGILITVVAPNVRQFLIQNRIIAEINELSGVVQFARAHAIDEQLNTVLCPSSNFSTCTDNWNDPKIVFGDADANGERGADEPLLVATSAINENNLLSGPAASIVFRGAGDVATPATMLLCHEERSDKYARALIVSLQGRVKMSRDSNGDGIHEDNSGMALDCG